MRVVIDTNIVVSGLVWFGTPRRVLDAAHAGLMTLFTSQALIDELRDVIFRSKLRTFLARVPTTPDEVVTTYQNLATRIDPVPPITPTAADPDDDAVLACAIAAQVDAIVTGDDHLLRLGSYLGIPILTASELLARLDSSTSP